jgi:ankyrin repeat protein
MGKTEIVELLLAKGANIEAQDNEGSTALHMGIFLNYQSIINTIFFIR